MYQANKAEGKIVNRNVILFDKMNGFSAWRESKLILLTGSWNRVIQMKEKINADLKRLQKAKMAWRFFIEALEQNEPKANKTNSPCICYTPNTVLW